MTKFSILWYVLLKCNLWNAQTFFHSMDEITNNYMSTYMCTRAIQYSYFCHIGTLTATRVFKKISVRPHVQQYQAFSARCSHRYFSNASRSSGGLKNDLSFLLFPFLRIRFSSLHFTQNQFESWPSNERYNLKSLP